MVESWPLYRNCRGAPECYDIIKGLRPDQQRRTHSGRGIGTVSNRALTPLRSNASATACPRHFRKGVRRANPGEPVIKEKRIISE